MGIGNNNPVKTSKDIYQHQPVAQSGFFVLTHSDTRQKVEDVARVSRFLKYPPGSITAEAVDKLECMSAEELMNLIR